MRLILSFYILIVSMTISFSNGFCQEKKISPWINVENVNKQNLRIDISTLKTQNDSDIYVWALETHNPPIRIEGIDRDIFKTKTYYLLNKPRMKYSLLEIVYYDSANNVLKDFKYGKKIEMVSYKYNFPIIANSPVEAILNKSIKELAIKNEKNK